MLEVTSYRKASFTGLTSALLPSVLFTPDVDVDLRVSLYFTNNVTANSGTGFLIILTWTDQNGIQSKTVLGTCGSGQLSSSDDCVIHALAGTDVTVQVNVLIANSFTADLYITASGN